MDRGAWLTAVHEVAQLDRTQGLNNSHKIMKTGHLNHFSGLKYIHSVQYIIVKVTQFYPTLCDLMDYIVHGILQARILE